MSYDSTLVYRVKDCGVLIPLNFVRDLCFIELCFKESPRFQGPYSKDPLNLTSEGQMLSSVRSTSQEGCECPTFVLSLI